MKRNGTAMGKEIDDICGRSVLFGIALVFAVATVGVFVSIVRGYYFLYDACIIIMCGTAIFLLFVILLIRMLR